ncbi:hypothetical protein TWF696_007540 [Orbilia brochopaga]|uniref:Uncharacterized protein n=1 Tax=Orbilia brochopaga TaxID=3140254 RepID=A0AAV9UKF5_9PEZI
MINPMETAHEESQQHASIVYCPSCGASISLPVIPPSNAGLYCDICTSPYLLLSTNDGVDWNPLSDAFNSLSLSHPADEAPPPPQPQPQVELEPQELQPEPSPDSLEPSHMQDEMKRRSLILSNLMNFRDSLHPGTGDMTDDDDAMSNMHRTLNSLYDLRRRSGMFLLDDVDTNQQFHGDMTMDTDTGNGYQHQHQHAYNGEEEGMFDDPPIDYVNAHPPIHDEILVHTHMNQTHWQNGQTNVEEEDDDEGQVYATPEQREQMMARRRELKMDKEVREREMLWRRYGVGNLGVGGDG